MNSNPLHKRNLGKNNPKKTSSKQQNPQFNIGIPYNPQFVPPNTQQPSNFSQQNHSQFLPTESYEHYPTECRGENSDENELEIGDDFEGAIRMIAYGAAADQVDEYVRISEATARLALIHFTKGIINQFGAEYLSEATARLALIHFTKGIINQFGAEYLSEATARLALIHFTKGIINQFGAEYLRKPSSDDLARLLAIGEQRGFPGMVGSVDCMHWEWKNCPAAWRGQYQGRAGKATLVLEAVADRDLWIWHAFFGMPGSYNDINVLYRSPLLVDMFEGRAPTVHFVINGTQYEHGYYLTDGIYPKWATFIQSITQPQTEKARLFAQHQEAARKDVERAFGVLQARFAIIRKPSLAWDEEQLVDIITSCIIMHNMIVEDERHRYKHYADIREFMKDQTQHRSGDRTSLDDDEPFEYYSDRIVDINQYLTNKDDVENRETHLALKQDLMEHIWEMFGSIRN